MGSQATAGTGRAPFDIKGRMTTLTYLRLRSADPDDVLDGLDARLAEAPDLFSGMPVVLEFPSDMEAAVETLTALRDGLAERGLAPVGVTGGAHLADTARAAGLAWLRASGVDAEAAARPRPAPAEAEPAVATARIVTQPVRSGQQVYARGGDLIVLAAVSPGAELLADGNIHVYGTLNGRALAGVQGNREARIFCRRFNAELVAIAGHYQISEHIEEADRGRELQIHLDGDVLCMSPLGG